MKYFIFLITLFSLSQVGAQPKKILLIGTFHFNNPGADVAKTKSFTIENKETQKELDLIAAKIKKFGPSKIFVEWPYQEQSKLDSLYNLYLNDLYFQNKNLDEFYKKNEIFQLAFRAAKLSHIERVYGIDYRETEFPFDSVMTTMASQKQDKLQQQFTDLIQSITSDFNNKISSGNSLRNLLYFLNSEEIRNQDLGFYLNLCTQVGTKENFIGAYLASEWYKRNIYMWSLIQKETSDKDERIMILLGSSHIAVLNQLLKANPNLELVELKDILK